MSNSQWFYSDAQQQQLGPVTFEQIQKLAASGQIQPNTLIWNEGMPNWTPANQVNGVFQASTPPPVKDQSTSPYTPPENDTLLQSSEGTYPIPPVKRSSPILVILFSIIGLALCFAGVAIGTTKAFQIIQEVTKEQRSTQPIETRDDAAEAQERLEELNKENIEEEILKRFNQDDLMNIGILVASGYLAFFIAWILGAIRIHRAWTVLQPGGARATPGKAAGLMLVPLFNFYWIFVAMGGWAKDWTRIQNTHSGLSSFPKASIGLFTTGCILFSSMVILWIIPILLLLVIFAFMILYLLMIAKMCSVVNAMADAQKNQS